MKKCYWCNKKIIKLNRDHFIPLSSGGRNTNSNIVDSCEFCNKSKNRNFWFKNKFGDVIKYRKPKKFINFSEDEFYKYVEISTIFIIRKDKKSRKKANYGERKEIAEDFLIIEKIVKRKEINANFTK